MRNMRSVARCLWLDLDAHAVGWFVGLVALNLWFAWDGLLGTPDEVAGQAVLLGAPIAFLAVAAWRRFGVVAVGVATAVGAASFRVDATALDTAVWACASGLGAALGASALVRLFCDRLGSGHLDVARDPVRFLLASLLSSGLPAVVSGLTWASLGHVDVSGAVLLALRWWMASTAALLTVAPFGLAWLARDEDLLARIGFGERLAALALLVATSTVVFHSVPFFGWARGLTWLVVPAAAWLAVRGSRLDAAAVLVLVTWVAVVGGVTGAPAGAIRGRADHLTLQGFLLVLAVATVATNLALRELRETNERLSRSYAELESRVAERTADLRRTNRRLVRQLDGSRSALSGTRCHIPADGDTRGGVWSLNEDAPRRARDGELARFADHTMTTPSSRLTVAS